MPKNILTPIALLAIMTILIYISLEDEITLNNIKSDDVIRNPAVAGTFYPGTKTNLKDTIQKYYDNLKDNNNQKDIQAIIVPHAGYKYSGQTAAFAYQNINNKNTIIILGPSHHTYFSGASIPNATHYKTPLGTIKLSDKTKDIRQELKDAGLLYTEKDAHKKEHSIEVQLPFLQGAQIDREIIPILIGSKTDYDKLIKISDILNKYTDENTLLIASSDFTHYGSIYNYQPFTEDIEKNIKDIDNKALEHIEKKDPRGFSDYIQKTGATICGNIPITTLLMMIQDKSEIKGELLHYDTSGHITGNFKNSVSYISYAFYRDETLNTDEQKQLTTLARTTLESYIKDKKIPKVNTDTLPQRLTEKKGCFVTLKKDNQLRGCIGHISPKEPLYKCVIENTISSALNDPRFKQVTYQELNDIKIEISILSIPKSLKFTSPDDLISRLTPLKDGVLLNYGFHKATYLPQVWEDLPDKKEFLTSLCTKSGAPPDCWKEDNVKIETYQAQVFSE